MTGRLFDRLVLHYGRDSVFRDIDNIRAGIDFRDQISEALAQTDVLLAIVGKRWLARSGFRRRISEESDLVRVEIETALDRRIPVLPILVGGAKMPDAGLLPPSLKRFSFRHSVSIDGGVEFENQFVRLRREIDRLLFREFQVPDGPTPHIEEQTHNGLNAPPRAPAAPSVSTIAEKIDGVENGASLADGQSRIQNTEREFIVPLTAQVSKREGGSPGRPIADDREKGQCVPAKGALAEKADTTVGFDGAVDPQTFPKDFGAASSTQARTFESVPPSRPVVVGNETDRGSLEEQATTETTVGARALAAPGHDTTGINNSKNEIGIVASERTRPSEGVASAGRGHILIVDDNETNRDILVTRLATQGYELSQAADGEEALAAAKRLIPDLILLDVMMPKIDGIEVCRRLKNDATLPFIPIILVTAKSDTKDVVTGLEAGADEYLTKPIDQTALIARVKAALRTKTLHDKVLAQSAELAASNRLLEERIAQQLAEIERMRELKWFLSPQIAELILSSGREHVLETHRSNITVVYCDLRGFTTFAETAAPEEVMSLLTEYHATLGALVNKYEGTVERFVGDAIMVLFNDPLPCPDPSLRAVKMAMEMRDSVTALGAKWRKLGHEIGFGIGIAQGYATLGRIGYEGRYDYAAVGTVTQLATRLCAEARNDQILIDAKVQAAVEDLIVTESCGELTLKGFSRPVRAYNVNLPNLSNR
jgi:class 3 adenylate cyclase/CheY-like chemotaxis protein